MQNRTVQTGGASLKLRLHSSVLSVNIVEPWDDQINTYAEILHLAVEYKVSH